MYAEILDRNKNDCSLPVETIMKKSSAVGMINFIKQYSSSIAKEILRCHKESKGKKAVVLPLSFINKAKSGGAHANALVFNTLQMTAEHFEPHGLKDYVPARKKQLQLPGVNLGGAITALNKEIKKQAKEQGQKEFSKGLKYVRPVDVCPSESMYKNFRGVQSFDRSNREPVEFEGFTIKEQAGYCQLWTYFLLELRLKTLDKPPQEVLKEYATYRDLYKASIGSDPNKTMMGLIRGYSKNYFNMIKQLIDEGAFTLEEFLTYRDINNIKEDRQNASRIFEKVRDKLVEAATKKMEKVMKDARM